MKLSSLKLDLNAVEDGIILNLEEGASLRVAQWDNPAHLAFKRSLFKKYNKKIEAKMITDEELQNHLDEEWVHIIRDMNGFEDFEYSPQAVVDLKRNPQFKAFFANVEKVSKDEKNYRVETIKSLGEDSLDSSNGQ